VAKPNGNRDLANPKKMPTRRLAAAQPEQQTVWDIASVLTPQTCEMQRHYPPRSKPDSRKQASKSNGSRTPQTQGEQNRFFHLKIKITMNLWRSAPSLSHFLLE
jgi:hypothetical protein